MLLIDLDPQANDTKVFMNPQDEIPLQWLLYKALLNFYPMGNIIQETQTKNLYLAPSHIRLSGTDLELSQAMDNRSERLKRTLEPLTQQYDYIITDTPPSLGLLTINALAARSAISPWPKYWETTWSPRWYLR